MSERVQVQLKVKRLRPSGDSLPFPRYQSEHASGLDLVADTDSEIVIAPLGRSMVPTGLAIEIPPGFEGQVRPRSGLALKHGVTILNAPGTIDSDYRGEVQVILVNLSNVAVTVKRGERIAQLVITPVTHATLVEVDELSSTERGIGGFGSTGR
jgi:dUTP pyrophosphatase